MKKQDLLDKKDYHIERRYIGTYGFPPRKRYYYMYVTKEGNRYKIRKYDVKDFIKQGVKYIIKD